MNQMKRLLPFLLIVALTPLFASCKSESKPDASKGATANATPTPFVVEVSTDTLKKDVQQNPEDTTAHYNLGTAYSYEGKFDAAAEEFKFVVSKNPNDSNALAKLGDSYKSAGKLEEAADAFRRALALTPDSADLHQSLADVYEKLGKASDASKERAQVERLRPNQRAAELYKDGKYEEALAELRKVSNKNAETHALIGSALLKLNEAKEAVSAFREAVKLKPDYSDAYFQLGNAYDRLNRQEDAAAAFREAGNLRRLEEVTGKRFGDAVNAYSQVINLKPDDADARYSLGLALLKNGAAAAAAEQYEALKTLNPNAADKLRQEIEKQKTEARP